MGTAGLYIYTMNILFTKDPFVIIGTSALHGIVEKLMASKSNINEHGTSVCLGVFDQLETKLKSIFRSKLGKLKFGFLFQQGSAKGLKVGGVAHVVCEWKEGERYVWVEKKGDTLCYIGRIWEIANGERN